MKLCVLIPAYNCAHVLPEVVNRIKLPGDSDEIIVVDDASADDTLAVAQKLPRVHAVRNPTNLGYGGTSQRLYQLAVERNADLTINIHGDLGHRPEEIPLVLAPLYAGRCDLAIGSRLMYLMNLGRDQGWLKLLSPQARNNMPLNRMLGHFGLTWFQNMCFRTNLHSFHDGMRGCTREVVDWILQNELTTWYNYDVEVLLLAARQKFRIEEVPVPPLYGDHAKSSAPAVRYGLRVVSFTLKAMRNTSQQPTRHGRST
jgi:glycosyltransferase involved in cell wall biosynthesis